ncbi:MAG: hypothetical protein QME77_07110 [bacterium]|nr:hypothetical protein [bacterium]
MEKVVHLRCPACRNERLLESRHGEIVAVYCRCSAHADVRGGSELTRMEKVPADEQVAVGGRR